MPAFIIALIWLLPTLSFANVVGVDLWKVPKTGSDEFLLLAVFGEQHSARAEEVSKQQSEYLLSFINTLRKTPRSLVIVEGDRTEYELRERNRILFDSQLFTLQKLALSSRTSGIVLSDLRGHALNEFLDYCTGILARKNDNEKLEAYMAASSRVKKKAVTGAQVIASVNAAIAHLEKLNRNKTKFDALLEHAIAEFKNGRDRLSLFFKSYLKKLDKPWKSMLSRGVGKVDAFPSEEAAEEFKALHPIFHNLLADIGFLAELEVHKDALTRAALYVGFSHSKAINHHLESLGAKNLMRKQFKGSDVAQLPLKELEAFNPELLEALGVISKEMGLR